MSLVKNQDIPYRDELYTYDDEVWYFGPAYRLELQESSYRTGYSEEWGVVVKSLRGNRPTFRSPEE